LKDANDTSSNIQFCWHCGADIRYQAQHDICDKCQAPLKESTRKQIFSRTSPAQSIKCWRCGGTTSGDVCGICGSALTMSGVGALQKEQEVVLEISDRIAVYSPKDRQFMSIDMTFDELKVTLENYVELIDAQNTEAGPVFIVRRPEDPKVTFAQLRKESMFKEKYLRTLIRNEQINPEIKEITIRFFYWKPDSVKEQFKFKKIGWNIGLYLATIITVSLAGWQIAKQSYAIYAFQGNLGLDIFLFTFSLLGILTVHEFGHYSVSKLKKLDASLPYFIPLPPLPISGFQTLGTFGALIRQKEPFATRDDLFEIGIAGPIGGFIITIPVFLIGLRLTYIVDYVAIEPTPLADIPTVLLADGLQYLGFALGIVPYYDPTIQMAVSHPMLLAGWIGFILTGINLVPASQLDGGHTTRAVFGGMAHRIVTFIFAGLLILNVHTRYFGFFILIFSFQPHPGATDDVSKVHWSKYVYLVLSWIVGIICLPLPIGQIQSLLQ
jgi:membrane-associated protease RseP (regulator of RpoE activity)